MKIQDFITPNTIIEIVCFLIGLICLLNDKNKVWKIFPIYLFINCITELFAIYLRKHHHNNQWPYNISIIFEATFISTMFLKLFNKYFKSKLFIIGGLALLLIAYGYDIKTHDFLLFKNITNDTLNEITNDLMSALFSIYSLSYFYLLLKDERYINLKYSSDFWWVVGILFFYFGSTTLNLFRSEFKSESGLPNYITLILIWIIYSCWSYSFICKKWLVAKSLS